MDTDSKKIIEIVKGGNVVDARNIQTWLREERKARGLTQGEVAAGVGINIGTLNKFERGWKGMRPRYELWEKIARFVNPEVSSDDLTEVYMNSAPDAKALDPEEKELLDAWRSNDITAMIHLVERMKKRARDTAA